MRWKERLLVQAQRDYNVARRQAQAAQAAQREQVGRASGHVAALQCCGCGCGGFVVLW
jgi:hypothetical protein